MLEVFLAIIGQFGHERGQIDARVFRAWLVPLAMEEGQSRAFRLKQAKRIFLIEASCIC